MNCRCITGVVMSSDDVHTLTSESQEAMVEKKAPAKFLGPDIDWALQIPIF